MKELSIIQVNKKKLENIQVNEYFIYLAENDKEVLVKTYDNQYKLLSDNSEKIINLNEAIKFYANNLKCD